MTSPALPAALKAALGAKLKGFARGEIAARAERISKTYRGGGGSAAIKSESDALAYALARMPATYAAATACLNALNEARPDFAPQSQLDVGAGPGTASFAAADAFSSLRMFTLFDANDALRRLALDLAQTSARFNALNYQAGEACALLGKANAADLVVASYLIGELAEAKQTDLTERLWSQTADTLLIVEPGTPRGYGRIIAARAQLIASGAYVLAPCPHDAPCPLQAPDWCHFAQRLPRARAHKELKGAQLPFEDEKFSYVILTRKPVTHRRARVLAPPNITKVEITAKLCTADRLSYAKVPHRDKPAYATARRWRWGDAVIAQG